MPLMQAGSARLDNWHKEVRQAAVKALAQIAEKGNPYAIARMSYSLEDENFRSGRMQVRHWTRLQRRATQIPSLQ